jgi:hypothetical protein
VRAVFVVVGNVLSEQSAKVALVEDDGAIKQFATDASDPALCDASAFTVERIRSLKIASRSKIRRRMAES